MTTAHRPTFDAARGKTNAAAPTRQYSSRSLPAHKILKYRSTVQSEVAGLNLASLEELKRDLLLAETAHFTSKPGMSYELEDKGQFLAKPDESIDSREHGGAAKRRRISAQGQIENVNILEKNRITEESDIKTEGESEEQRINKSEIEQDEDDSDDEDDEDHDDDDDCDDDDADDTDEDDDNEDDEDDDEDDAAELMRELEKIKAERAAERHAKEVELAAEEQAKREEEIAFSNPLMNPAGQDFMLQRRWDQDVVFRVKEQKADAKKDFVNDLLRSDFHRSFMKKYIR